MIARSSHGLAREAGVVAFFLALSLLATRPLVFHSRTHTLAGGDPLVDLWTINWLSGHLLPPSETFQGNIFHPTPHAVLYSDLSLGTAVLLLPFRLFVHDPVPLYNMGLWLALAFAAWSFHLLARFLTGSLWGGLLAGTLAAFGSHQMAHLVHLNLLTTGWLALLILALHGILKRPGPGFVILAGTSASLSAQSSGYYAVGAVILSLVFLLCSWRLLDRRRAMALGGAMCLAALLTAPYLVAYLKVYSEEGLRRPLGMSSHMAFHPRRDLTSHGYLYGAILGSGGEQLFPGILTLALTGIAVWRRAPGLRFLGAASLCLLVISLGPSLSVLGLDLPLPYRWLHALPSLDGMRHPYTFAGIAVLLLSVLAGIGWASLRLPPWCGGVVVLLAILETLAPGVSLQAIPEGLPPYYELLRAAPPGPILEIPVFSEEVLVWAARHGGPMLNGQGSAFVPSNTMVLERLIENHWIKHAPDDVDRSKPTAFLMDRFSLRYLVIPSGRQRELGGLAASFDRSHLFRLLGVAADGDRVYELREASQARLGSPGLPGLDP